MNPALTRLLQLASPALPVGAFSYSQGLEWAIEAGTVRDEATALRWIADQLEWNLGNYEAPMLARLLAAHKVGAGGTVTELDALYLASRESAELRAETLQMGHSLRKLILDLSLPIAVPPQPTFPTAWAALAAYWDIAADEALAAWLWSWAENQVMAALKAVPLGQLAGQRMLLELGRRIPAVVGHALALGDDELSNFAPGFAIACARHETQYSRLFRS
ncbi:MAG: urease accessory protein UreF [Rhodocyclales bacterium]|nr:urease accessory protein UreF [Rhodocyclales bacterium]